MPIHRFTIELPTEGGGEVIDLGPLVAERLRTVRETPAGKGPGLLSLFVVGSTAALTTLEYEVGLVKHDLPALLQRLIPDDARYEHEATWHDDNGHSHLRAALVGPSLSVPVQDGRLVTGEYQQVVLIDFDTRPRKRTVIGTIVT
ncbi:MAG TPA: secondary thiamine-phosphate synthase enzyme YjbQ [Humisphaera sp.]